MSNAIIIIDVGAINKEDHRRVINTNILSLLDNIRCPVIFSYYFNNNTDEEWDKNIIDEKVYMACKHSPALYNNGSGFYETENRIVIDPRIFDHEAEAIKFLNNYNVKNLYFCGYSLPGCVFNRPLGIRNFKRLGFNCSAILDICIPGHTIRGDGEIISLIHAQYKFCKSLDIPIVYHEMFNKDGSIENYPPFTDEMSKKLEYYYE